MLGKGKQKDNNKLRGSQKATEAQGEGSKYTASISTRNLTKLTECQPDLTLVRLTFIISDRRLFLLITLDFFRLGGMFVGCPVWPVTCKC